jgi:hypothetical protein
MLVNDVLSTAQSAEQVSVKLKLSAQSIAEFAALVQGPDPGELSCELVGLLFGTVKQETVQVETIRQLPVQAPGCVFCRFTRKHFETILVTARLDPELEPLEIVGWYRFHADHDDRLLPFEIQFHERFFPRHEDLGLILTGDRPDNLRISVCSRSRDGSFSRTQHASTAIQLHALPSGGVAVDLQAGPLFSETTYIKAYEALDGIGDQGPQRKWPGIATAAAALAGALTGLFFTVHRDRIAAVVDPAPPFSLTLATKGPELRVSWSGGIVNPKQAQLRVLDGDSVDRIDVMRNYRPNQSIALQRHSGNIQATLVVSDGYRSWETHSSLIDSTAAVQVAQASRTSDAGTASLNKLREENKQPRNRTDAAKRSRRSRR